MLAKKGGFQGDFTITTPLKLRDGLRVRVAHGKGRLLRLKVTEGSRDRSARSH